MSTHSFFVPGDPRPQPRPRATVRGGQARMYNPDTANAWKQAVRVAATDAGLMAAEIEGPIRLGLDFRFQRPASHYKRGHALKPSAPQWHIQRPDLDNLVKAVMDALTDVAAWGDDDQIYDLRVTKGWVPSESGCQVTMWTPPFLAD